MIRRIPWDRSGARARPRAKYVEGLEAESGGREICTKGTLRGFVAGSKAKFVNTFYIIFFFDPSYLINLHLPPHTLDLHKICMGMGI